MHAKTCKSYNNSSKPKMNRLSEASCDDFEANLWIRFCLAQSVALGK